MLLPLATSVLQHKPVWLQPHLPGSCAAIRKFTKYGVSEYGHVHTGPDFDADGIRVSCGISWLLLPHPEPTADRLAAQHICHPSPLASRLISVASGYVVIAATLNSIHARL